MDKWRIERIADSHDRGQFQSGHASLDNFLQALAGQHERRHLSATYVAVREEEWRVVGYYTLVANSVSPNVLPPKIARRFPKHSVPVVLLGRLAVDRSYQGQGLGRLLLWDALERCLRLSQEMGIFAIEVHASVK